MMGVSVVRVQLDRSEKLALGAIPIPFVIELEKGQGSVRLHQIGVQFQGFRYCPPGVGKSVIGRQIRVPGSRYPRVGETSISQSIPGILLDRLVKVLDSLP